MAAAKPISEEFTTRDNWKIIISLAFSILMDVYWNANHHGHMTAIKDFCVYTKEMKLS